jgi:surface antigen
MNDSLQRNWHKLVSAALPAVIVAGGVLGASPQASASGPPAPNRYDTAPPCRPSSNHQYVGTYCGPWTVPLDSANPFAMSYGECVYWAIEKRPDIWNGRSSNDPEAEDWDAWTWVGHAQAEGLRVSGLPEAGDVVVWSRAQAGNSTGHVAYVEAVNPDQSITVSEMNHYFGTQGGDTETLAPLAGPGGWRGLEFIHASSANSGPDPLSGQAWTRSLTPSREKHTRSRSAVRISLSDLKQGGRHQRLITFKVRISHGRGRPRVFAVSGSQRIRFRFKRTSPRSFVFRAVLSPGRWTVVVRVLPARGYAAPRPIRLQASIPPQ